MKKYLLVAALVLGVVAADARDYKHSIGVNVGTLYGISYKGYVRESEHFVFQMDANVQLGFAPKSHMFLYDDKGKSISDASVNAFDFKAFYANPNLMYQGNVGDWSWASMHWFIGGGIDLGMTWETYKALGVSDTQYGVKFSEHAIGGIEFDFKGAPLNLGVDFRPGLGQLIYFPEGTKTYTTTVFFDWGVAVALRYRI